MTGGSKKMQDLKPQSPASAEMGSEIPEMGYHTAATHGQQFIRFGIA